MRILLIVLFALISIATLFSSCTNERQRTFDQITQLQDSLYSKESGIVDPAVAEKLLEECMRYAETWPDDTLSAGLMLKAKDYALFINDPLRSVKIMEQFMDKYPEHPQSNQLSFALAFVYENYLGNMDKARENYELFLKYNPDQGKMSEDARFALQNLGKTAEEIMEGFAGVPTDSLP